MISKRVVALCLLFCTICLPGFADRYQDYDIVVLQILDKITARTEVLNVAVGETVEIDKLSLTPKACKKTKPTEAPETIAFLKIDQLDHDMIFKNRLFSGWMFASAPALSALEHPIIDVKLLDCEHLSHNERADLYVEDMIEEFTYPIN